MIASSQLPCCTEYPQRAVLWPQACGEQHCKESGMHAALRARHGVELLLQNIQASGLPAARLPCPLHAALLRKQEWALPDCEGTCCPMRSRAKFTMYPNVWAKNCDRT